MSQKGRFNLERTFGVEIECCVPRSVTSNSRHVMKSTLQDLTGLPLTGWVVKGDPTVRSTWSTHTGNWEIVSPPLKGREGLEETRKVYDALETLDVRVNRSCGMHVHHDINDWKRAGVRAQNTSTSSPQRTGILSNLRMAVKKVLYLISIVARYEHVIYSVLPKSRLVGTYSMPINKCYNVRFRKSDGDGVQYTSMYGAPQEERDRGRVTSQFSNRTNGLRNRSIKSFLLNRMGHNSRFQTSRYCGLNFGAFWRQGTVEFRMGGATVSSTKAINWVVFTQLFVNMAEVRAEQGRKIRMTTPEPYKTKADRKIALGHLKVVLGITKSGMDARQGITRDPEVKVLDAYLSERQETFSANWNDQGFGGRMI